MKLSGRWLLLYIDMSLAFLHPVLLAQLDSVPGKLIWWVAGGIVILGLFGLGFRDVIRFSIKRVWAISSVSFSEAIRKRVLWITPLAIIGIIVVSQLQRALDEQDVIRQTIKVCLFTTGLLVTVTAIILAATNLPKEIENRVIFTIVTKPTTRLEVVAGKVLGFARVSAMILLIMGLFTLGYLHLRAWNIRKEIEARIDGGVVSGESELATLRHYASPGGLLTAHSFEEPDDLQLYARQPNPQDRRRWVLGDQEQEIIIPFEPPQGIFSHLADLPGPIRPRVLIVANIGYQRFTSSGSPENEEEVPATLPTLGPTTGLIQEPLPPPRISFSILDQNLYTLVAPEELNFGKPVELGDPRGSVTTAEIPANIAVDKLSEAKIFYVQIVGLDSGVEYSIEHEGTPVFLLVPGLTRGEPFKIDPLSLKGADRPSPPIFRGRYGTYGQQLRGGTDKAPVSVYQFRQAEIPAVSSNEVPFQMNIGIERSGEELSSEDIVTRLSLQFHNTQSGKTAEVEIRPESNRTAYFSVPAEAVAGGNFNVSIRGHTPGHWAGLKNASLRLVTGRQPFFFNLFKSLFIMWLLAVLVVIIAIFCSTFLSWPIAIVLTLLILLGRWGVDQLGDAIQPGFGRTVANDLGLSDAARARAVSESVEALSQMLNLVSSVLPDISSFSATDEIERGITIPASRLRESLLVLALFGLPMIVLSYIFLKNKEVAP